MKLRTKFILFVIILHLIPLVLSYFIFRQNKILFIVAELCIIISLIISWQLYNQLIQPLQLLVQGADAIKDRDFNIKFAATGQYEMDELIKVYNQMADELRTERTRREQQHRFLEKLIETSPTGILILDFDDKIDDLNPRASKLLNIEKEEIAGKPIDEVTHPLIVQARPLKSGEAKTVTLNGVNTYKIQKSHFIDRGFARHFILIEELSAEILAAEKKAYGKVIRMMAHEVNNTIGPVNSILQSALSSGKIWNDGASDTLRNALQVAYDRNTNLSIFMRNFTEIVRLPEPKRSRIDINKLVSSIAQFWEMLAADKRIKFEYDLDEEPLLIDGDEQQMQQVFINVVKNSIEAIDKQGVINIRTSSALRQLVVTDNGRGIDPQIASQLFTPFFSTKSYGQGIGLTLVKEILINHGFEFSLHNDPSGGTQFIFKF